MKIYFGFTVAGDRSAIDTARRVVELLEEYGHEVLTRHLVDANASEADRLISPQDVYRRDMAWLEQCDIFIAEVSGSSFGLGFETGYLLGATSKKVILLSRGRLDLSALPTLSTDPLPALLGAYRQAYPAVTVHIPSPGDPDELAEQVRTGAAEVGVPAASRAADGLVSVPFRGQQLVAVFPPGSAEPAGLLRPGSLADVPLIVTPPGSSGRRLLEAALGLEGLRPLVAIETSQREAILPLVLAGAGAAVMPEAIAVLAAAQGAVPVPFDPRLMRALVIVHRPGSPPPAAVAFLAVAARLATRPDV